MALSYANSQILCGFDCSLVNQYVGVNFSN